MTWLVRKVRYSELARLGMIGVLENDESSKQSNENHVRVSNWNTLLVANIPRPIRNIKQDVTILTTSLLHRERDERSVDRGQEDSKDLIISFPPYVCSAHNHSYHRVPHIPSEYHHDNVYTDSPAPIPNPPLLPPLLHACISSSPSITAHSHQPPFIKALTKAKELHGNAIPRDRNEHTEDVHRIQHLNCVYGQSKRSEARVERIGRSDLYSCFGRDGPGRVSSISWEVEEIYVSAKDIWWDWRCVVVL